MWMIFNLSCGCELDFNKIYVPCAYYTVYLDLSLSVPECLEHVLESTISFGMFPVLTKMKPW
jgi:hypothetical protein